MERLRITVEEETPTDCRLDRYLTDHLDMFTRDSIGFFNKLVFRVAENNLSVVAPCCAGNIGDASCCGCRADRLCSGS